ncbi:MAG: hypothetical protein HW402_1369 [Dehalococcoidales bacterium]|nr:hypothetical protein [Dehalococcoidales bacterium]
MKPWFKRGQKGFTLVELMVVMAIMAVLTSIVFTAVSGTAETSVDTQTRQDGSTVNAAVNDYYGDQVGAEVFTTNTTTILSSTPTTKDVSQTITTRWPEKYLTVTYLAEFPLVSGNTTTTTTSNNVTTTTVLTEVTASLNITNADNTTITAQELAAGWNAINLSALFSSNYIPAVPRSSEDLSGNFHNYLWLMKKTQATAGGIITESRKVEVFKLTKVVKNETTKNYTLTYKQIY